MRIPEIKLCLADCLDADQPAIVWGPRGIGKSQAVSQLASERGARLFDVRLSDLDSVDLRGLPAAENGRTIWLRPDMWPEDEAGETILFFDELDRPSSPAVLNVALQIFLDRKIGPHRLPGNVRILAAANGATDKGTTKFSNALSNRMSHFYAEYDAAATRDHFRAIGLPVEIGAFLHLRPDLGNVMAAPAAGEHASASPRQWERFARFMNSPRRRAHATALLGSAVAGEFEAFCGIFGRVPKIADILADPSGAPVVDEPSLHYAVATALARAATRQNFADVQTYLNRMPREFAVMATLDATKRDASLKETAAYVAWAARNQDAA